MADDIARAFMTSAQRLGIDPVDLATVVSYETGGTFDPWQKGPTTQWGQHRGLIQAGEPQRKKYGIYEGQSVADQLQSAEHYLTDAGVRPGMGLLDVYSAINAGRVGRYNASDANNGGAPGTVADKVNNQMGGHRKKAEQLLAGLYTPSANSAGVQPMGGNQAIAAAQPPGASPAAFFGDVIAPQPEAPFGNVVANYLQSRKQRDDQAEAENTKRQALLASVGSPFGRG